MSIKRTMVALMRVVDEPAPAAPALTVAQVYEEHANFVWATLHRMGIAQADLPDVTHEVFLVVHRRLGTYDAQSRLKSWLYGICRRVAAAHRRRAYRRRERVTDMPESIAPVTTRTPEDEAMARAAQRQLAELLDSLDVDKRAVFVMFEIEGLACEEIARQLDIPVGTVYSRLHAARREFEKRVDRLRQAHAREASR